MKGWIAPKRVNTDLDDLVKEYRSKVLPILDRTVALDKLRKQRRKRIEQIEKLQHEAAALFAVIQEVERKEI